MKRVIAAFTLLLMSSLAARAEDVDGNAVVRMGLGALRQNLSSSGTAVGLGGSDVLVGYGLWMKLYQEHVSVEDGIRSEAGHVRDFIEEAERLIDNGLTLAQLVRRAFPQVQGELRPERIMSLALRPFGNQINDLRESLVRWAKDATWSNVGETCGPTLAE